DIPVLAVAVGGGISQELAFRAAITIHRAVVDEFRLAHHAGFGWCRIAIAGDTENGALLQSLGDAGCGIAGIEPDGADSKAEALTLPVKPPQIDDAVMDVCRGDVGIGDDGKLSIHRAVVEIEE